MQNACCIDTCKFRRWYIIHWKHAHYAEPKKKKKNRTPKFNHVLSFDHTLKHLGNEVRCLLSVSRSKSTLHASWSSLTKYQEALLLGSAWHSYLELENSNPFLHSNHPTVVWHSAARPMTVICSVNSSHIPVIFCSLLL